MRKKILDWFGFGDVGHGQTNGKHGHAHRASHGDEHHGHTHGVIDATIATTDRGIWAIKWSFVILMATGALQVAVVILSSSVALLADTIHNFADATTAIPLWVAFLLARRKPSRTFTYGLGRVEDLAGILIVLIILFSAIVAGYEAIFRLVNPHPVSNLALLAAAGAISFFGNEFVAVLRIRVGREINSAALIADGYHARTDGLTSLAVVAGALGVWLGFPLADPLVGLGITFAIFVIVWQSARSVLTRMLDGVEPELVDEIEHAASHVSGIDAIVETKARWLGHKLHVDIVLALDEGMLLAEANAVAATLQDAMFAHIPALSAAKIRFAPPSSDHGHSHALAPFRITGRLATGLLQIFDTGAGERFQLRVSRHAEGLRAEVKIQREAGKIERLALVPVDGNHHLLRSSTPPAEPHEFDATLTLEALGVQETLKFRMFEPPQIHQKTSRQNSA